MKSSLKASGLAIAAVLGLSTATVGRRFRIAKAWLYRRLSRDG